MFKLENTAKTLALQTYKILQTEYCNADRTT